MTGTIKSRFIGVNIRQSAEKKKGTGPFSIALFHNLKFIDTGDECDSSLFKVNQAGGVYEAHGEDFSFEPFRQPVHSAGKVFSGRYTLVWHARILKWLINSRLLGYGSQPLCK